MGAFPLDRRYGLDRGFDHYGDRMPRGIAMVSRSKVALARLRRLAAGIVVLQWQAELPSLGWAGLLWPGNWRRLHRKLVALGAAVRAVEGRAEAHVRLSEAQPEHVRLDTWPPVEQVLRQRLVVDGDARRHASITSV